MLLDQLFVTSQAGDTVDVALVEARTDHGFLRQRGDDNQDVFAGTAIAHALIIVQFDHSSHATNFAEDRMPRFLLRRLHAIWLSTGALLALNRFLRNQAA